MTLTDIGAKIKDVTGITPTYTLAATVNGDAINRDGFLSAVARFNTGLMSVAGTFTADAKLQHSPSGTADWTDVVALPQLLGDNTVSAEVSVDVNLKPLQKFLRVIATIAFPTGTTPSMPIAATVILGGAIETPV